VGILPALRGLPRKSISGYNQTYFFERFAFIAGRDARAPYYAEKEKH
jgi:hypothetical protein